MTDQLRPYGRAASLSLQILVRIRLTVPPPPTARGFLILNRISVLRGVRVGMRLPLSLRNVEDLLHKRGIEISHETVRFW